MPPWPMCSSSPPTPTCSTRSCGPPTPRARTTSSAAPGPIPRTWPTGSGGFGGVGVLDEAARRVGPPSVFGAELSRGGARPPSGEPDPEGRHLVVLADGPSGYARLAATITRAQVAGEEGAPGFTLDALA